MTFASLATRWAQLFPEADGDAVQSAFNQLQRDYEEAGRYYHTLEHVGQMLEAQERYFPHASREQVLAIFLHDIVYDARRPDNEERSADAGSTMIRSLGVSESVAAGVAALILCTKTHTASSEQESQLCDLDLISLGLSADEYQANTAAIRKEYRHASEAEWAQGRREFIDRFLARPQIYTTSEIRDEFESAARRNLDHERSLLH